MLRNLSLTIFSAFTLSAQTTPTFALDHASEIAFYQKATGVVYFAQARCTDLRVDTNHLAFLSIQLHVTSDEILAFASDKASISILKDSFEQAAEDQGIAKWCTDAMYMFGPRGKLMSNILIGTE
jgi:hypothetical protein